MGRFHELRMRSEAFCANIDERVNEAILFVEQPILDLTRGRLFNRQKDSSGANMPEYSSKWKSIKGLTYWNLFQTGDLFNKMFLNVDSKKYKIDSKSWHSERIEKRAGVPASENFYAVAESESEKAKQITGKAFKTKYESQVLK